jgi:hypothetical protein
MQISFDIAGTPAEFRRKSSTGKAELLVGDDVVTLQSPLRVSTHFNFKTTQTWRYEVGGHVVEIVKVRPRFVGGLRESSYTISVADNQVAAAAGL